MKKYECKRDGTRKNRSFWFIFLDLLENLMFIYPNLGNFMLFSDGAEGICQKSDWFRWIFQRRCSEELWNFKKIWPLSFRKWQNSLHIHFKMSIYFWYENIHTFDFFYHQDSLPKKLGMNLGLLLLFSVHIKILIFMVKNRTQSCFRTLNVRYFYSVVRNQF